MSFGWEVLALAFDLNMLDDLSLPKSNMGKKVMLIIAGSACFKYRSKRLGCVGSIAKAFMVGAMY